MIDYTTGMIARSEHEYMKQSLAPVSDFDGRSLYHQPRGASTWPGKLFKSIANVVTSFGKASSHKPEKPIDEHFSQPHGSSIA
jgi:hypothetical protein